MREGGVRQIGAPRRTLRAPRPPRRRRVHGFPQSRRRRADRAGGRRQAVVDVGGAIAEGLAADADAGRRAGAARGAARRRVARRGDSGALRGDRGQRRIPRRRLSCAARHGGRGCRTVVSRAAPARASERRSPRASIPRRRSSLRAEAERAVSAATLQPSLRDRLASRGIDGVTLLALPAAAVHAGAVRLSLRLWRVAVVRRRRPGGALANYARFFTDPFLADTHCRARSGLPCRLRSSTSSSPSRRRCGCACCAASAC